MTSESDDCEGCGASRQRKESEVRTQQPVEAWAIKAPDGVFRLDTISNSMTGAVIRFTDGNRDWKRRYTQGYRCVRVRVQEVEG